MVSSKEEDYSDLKGTVSNTDYEKSTTGITDYLY